ncbi:reverse transcriptase domain-containing protein [Tanacetum coccineum]
MELVDHVLVYIPEPEHSEDLVPAEDEAPIEAYITEVASEPTPPLPPPSFLPLLIRPPWTPPLLPIPLPSPSTSRRADIPEADTPPRKRLLLTAPRPRGEVGESSAAAAARQPGPTMARRVDYSFVDTVETRVRDTKRRMMAAVEVVNLRVSHQADVHRRESSEFYSRHHDAQKDRAAVRAEIEILRRERLAYEQESIETRQALARSEAYSRALEARITVLETQARHHEWQRQDADDHAIEHIMRIQALEAGACKDTLEDTGRSAYGTMATINQGMSVEEIEQIVAQLVANAIEAIAIYESINQTKQRENKVVGNASNKRKWEGDQNGSPNQQQNKEHKVFRAHSVGPNYKKEYLGSLHLCNKCKFYHIGLCAARCENYKWRGHQARDCRISGLKTKPRPSMAKLKAEVTCYKCGELRNYKRDCPLVKFQNRVDKYWKGKAHGDFNATTSNINI